MSFIDDARKMATMPVPGPTGSEEHAKLFDAMPIEELASTWRALQWVGVRDRTEGTWAARVYFDHLPHQQPERALALALEVLRTETDIAVLQQLNDKLMLALVGNHGAALIDTIENEAARNPRLRWLLGGAHWWGENEAVKARLAAVADEAQWRADRDALREPKERIDFPSLSIPELARVWVAQHSKLEKDYDANWYDLLDYEHELEDNEPDIAIDLILEILKREDAEPLLGLLAAGLLENTISMDSIARVEREAAANEKFRWLLGGVWYWNAPEELKARLDAIVGDQHW